MKLEAIRYGQRIRVNVPGIGDHGQVGTVTRVRDVRCFVHLDWDQRPRHAVVFYAADLEGLPDEPVRPREMDPGAELHNDVRSLDRHDTCSREML